MRWRDIGSETFTWSDAWAILSTTPHDSPLSKALNPDGWFWRDPVFQMQANSFEALVQLGQLSGNQTGVSAREMFHLERPGDRRNEKTTIGAEPVPIEEMNDWLGWA